MTGTIKLPPPRLELKVKRHAILSVAFTPFTPYSDADNDMIFTVMIKFQDDLKQKGYQSKKRFRFYTPKKVKKIDMELSIWKIS